MAKVITVSLTDEQEYCLNVYSQLPYHSGKFPNGAEDVIKLAVAQQVKAALDTCPPPSVMSARMAAKQAQEQIDAASQPTVTVSS